MQRYIRNAFIISCALAVTLVEAQQVGKLRTFKLLDNDCMAKLPPELPSECEPEKEFDKRMACLRQRCIRNVAYAEDIAQALEEQRKLIQEAEIRARKREQAMCISLGHTSAQCAAAVPKAD